MDKETRLWRFRLSRIAESARQIGVALVLTGAISLFYDPSAAGWGAVGALCTGIAGLAYGWTR